MSQDFPEIQKLLQLRGQAGPGDEYFEEFLDEFHRRQRADLMKRSARSLFLERFTVWFREMGTARWVFGAATAYVVLIVLFVVWPKGQPKGEGLIPASQQMEIVPEEERLNIPKYDRAKSEVVTPATPREF